MNATREDLRQLRRALDANRHHLAEKRHWLIPLLHNTLQGRLAEAPALAAEVESAAKRERRPWFRLQQRPPEYDSALIRVIPQTGHVHCIAVVQPPKFDRPLEGSNWTDEQFYRWRADQVTRWQNESVLHRTMAVAVDDEVKLFDWSTGLAIDHEPMVHEGAVNSVAIIKHQGLIVVASGSSDRTVRLWRGDGVPLTQEPMHHQASVLSVALQEHQDRLVVASGSEDKTVCLWNGIDGEQLLHARMQHQERVNGVAMVEYQSKLVVASSCGQGSANGEVHIWNKVLDACLQDTVMRHDEPHYEDVTGAVFSVAMQVHAGQVVVAAGVGGPIWRSAVRLWDVVIGAPWPHTLIKHSGDEIVVSLMEHRGRLIVASGSKNHMVCLWDGASGASLSLAPMMHDSRVQSVALLEHQGQLLVASGGANVPCPGTVRLWGCSGVGPLPQAPMLFDSRVEEVACMEHAGQLVVAAMSGSTISLWDGTGDAPRALEDKHYAHSSPTCMTLVNHEGQLMIATGTHGNTVLLFDGGTRKLVTRMPVAHEGSVNCVAMTVYENQLIVASASTDKTVRLWDCGRGSLTKHASMRHEAKVKTVAILEHFGRLVMVSGSEDGTVRLWDGVTGDPLAHAPMRHEWIRTVALLEHEGRLMVVSQGWFELRLWDGLNGQPLCAPLQQDENIFPFLFFSPNSHLVLTGSRDCSLRLWSVPTGRLLSVCPLETPPRAAHFLASGELAVVVDGHQLHSLSLLRFNLRNLQPIARSDWSTQPR